ncbi:hypothetical protein KHA90_04915 [Flavobacterium psychroterrae]|uniref:Uncharacterized protein n=1 Tax=Flavobacterium psychroterrae TaxID=2133767 RepID=A0ABS5P7U5_9FLAO|nr:hypothetical protein [Flavobacterium psychroterrae]MBS7230357.1 hypothetical protein [Flavobacterium psychroterrae]
MDRTFRIKSVNGDTSFQHVTLKITPNVDGDYFDMQGNYLGSTANSQKKIYILGLDPTGMPYSSSNIPEDFFDEQVSFTGIGNVVNLRAGTKYGTIVTNISRDIKLIVSKKILSHYYTDAGYDLNELKYKSITQVPDKIIGGTFAIARLGGTSPNSEELREGEIDISVNLSRFGSSINTGWDAINLFAHERGQHIKDLLKYKKTLWDVFPGPHKVEHRAYMYQLNHPTWVKTSPEFKKQIWYVISAYVHKTEYEPYFKD